MVASFVPASSIEVLEDRVAPAALSPLFSYRSALHAGASHSAAYNSYVSALSKLVHYTPAVYKTTWSFVSGGSSSGYGSSDGFMLSGSIAVNNHYAAAGSTSTIVTGGTLMLGGGLVKTGTGALDLSTLPTVTSGGTLNITGGITSSITAGVITYTGGSVGGSLSIAGAGSTGAVTTSNPGGNITFTGSTNVISSGVTINVGGAIGVNTGLIKSGTGSLVLTAGGTFVGGIQLNQGTLSTQADGTLTLGADGTLTPNSDGTFTLAGGATIKIGAGVAQPLTVPTGSTIIVHVIGDVSSVPTLTGGGTLIFGANQPVHAINFSLGTGIARITATGNSDSSTVVTTTTTTSGGAEAGV